MLFFVPFVLLSSFTCYFLVHLILCVIYLFVRMRVCVCFTLLLLHLPLLP